MKITGIDPGRSGAISQITLDEHDRIVAVSYCRMPESFADLQLSLTKLTRDSDLVVVEQVGNFNNSRNHTIAFRFGFYVGRLYAAIELCELAPIQMSPAEWHAIIGLKHYRGNGKERSIACIRELVPTVSFVPSGCRVPHDGLVEATLIAYAAALKRRSSHVDTTKKSNPRDALLNARRDAELCR